MLDSYEEIKSLKNEINTYIDLLNESNKLPNNNNLVYISKLLLFNKKFFEYYDEGNCYYKNYMIYNLLMIMHSLNKNSVIYFYQLYRSYIENFIRGTLNLKDDDESGVNNLFKQLEETFNSTSEIKEIVYFIKGEYSKACDFVHSNIKANISVYLFYTDILESDEMNDKKITSLILKTQKLLTENTKLLILSFPNKVASIFYRKNTELKFLLGDKLFLQYKDALNKFE